MGLARELANGGEESGREVFGAESLEVHRQECDVGEHVAVPQLVIELEAVEDARPVGEEEDVARLQIAVTVDDPPGGDPGRRTTARVR